MSETSKNYIYVKENGISDSCCDQVITFLDHTKLELFTHYKGKREIPPFEQTWWEQYCMALGEYKKQHPFFATGQIGQWYTDEVCNYQKYETNQRYSIEHCEHGPGISSSRVLAWMFYCNTIEKGGETVFPQQNIKIKPKKGTIVFWPAGWTHSHYGNPCDQEKYIVTGWCCFLNK